MQVRGTQSVVDCLLEYSGKHKAGLIIMGSQQVLLVAHTSPHSLTHLNATVMLCSSSM